MKSTFKKLFLSAFVAGSVFATSANAQELLWGGIDDPNSTFDGGFNDWQAVGISCSNGVNGPVSGDNALWQWGIAPRSQGAYAGTTVLPFASPTAANGAVIFDSDFMDTNGTANAFGTGTCPSEHRGELISPIIDMTGNEGVALEFYQYYRRFAGPGSSQTVTASYIEVSADGGETWTSVQMNQATQVNSATANPALGFLNVSQWADNNPNFRFKFVFDGDFYFWAIDDVSLVSIPEVHFTGTRFLFSGKNLTQAQFAINRDSLQFAYEVENLGRDIDLDLTVEVTNNETNEVVHSQTAKLNVPSGATKGTYFDEIWNPQGLAVGNYTITYTATDELGREDFSPDDNVRTFPLRVSESNTINGQAGGGGILLSGVDTQWGYGGHFFGPDLSRDPHIEKVELASVSTHFSNFGASTLDGKTASFYLLELGPEWFTNNTGDIFSEGGAFTMMAVGEYGLTQAESGINVTPVLENLHTDDASEPVEIRDGQEYFIIALVPDSVQVGAVRGYPAYSVQYDEENNPINTTSVTIHSSRIYNGSAFSGNFSVASSYWDLQFNIIIVSNAPKLSKESYKVFPNPASNGYVNVELNFEQNMETFIYLTDINGRLFSHQTVNAANEIHRIDTNNLPAGTYIVTISNEKGLATEKVIVIR